jgi:hypothetical protein
MRESAPASQLLAHFEYLLLVVASDASLWPDSIQFEDQFLQWGRDHMVTASLETRAAWNQDHKLLRNHKLATYLALTR